MTSSEEALNHLCLKKNKVSAHFLISKQGKIYNLVDLRKRAWHAGKAFWKNELDINSQSIGIEIDNSGELLKNEKYTSLQISALKKLLDFLIKSYKINKENILGHSDVSPYRKIDPGRKFPWSILDKLFSNNSLIKSKKKKFLKKDILIKKNLLKKTKKNALLILSIIGYDVTPAKKSKIQYSKLIRVYQLHYRNDEVTGKLDQNTYELLLNQYKEILTI